MPASFAVSLTPLMMATRLRAHRWCALFTGHTTPYAGIIAPTRYAASGRFSFLHPPHGSICCGSFGSNPHTLMQ